MIMQLNNISDQSSMIIVINEKLLEQIKIYVNCKLKLVKTVAILIYNNKWNGINNVKFT